MATDTIKAAWIGAAVAILCTIVTVSVTLAITEKTVTVSLQDETGDFFTKK